MFRRAKSSESVLFLLSDQTEAAARFSPEQEPSVLEVAVDHAIEIDHSCAGSGTCGTCRVFIENPELLEARNEIELEMAQDRQFASNERLACQILACPGLRVRVP